MEPTTLRLNGSQSIDHFLLFEFLWLLLSVLVLWVCFVGGSWIQRRNIYSNVESVSFCLDKDESTFICIL